MSLARTVQEARPWAELLGRAARALRLNRSFVPHRSWADHLRACVDEELRVDGSSGLPTARSWTRARVEAESAAALLEELESLDVRALSEAHRRRHEARVERLHWLGGRALLPASRVEVAFRGWSTPERASYRVRVDRLDPATGVASRTTVVLEDEPGGRVSPGELENHASDAFSALVEALSTQDAAFIHAALEEQPGLEVMEVVRGVVGPAFYRWPDGQHTGPAVLLEAGLEGPLLCALQERVSEDVARPRVDEPLQSSLSVPAPGARAKLSRHRKWSLPRAQAPELRAWLAARDSRGLLYPC